MNLKYLFGHKFVGIDIQTTGQDPKEDEIMQIAFLLTSHTLDPIFDPMPLNMFLKPDMKLERSKRKVTNTKFAHNYAQMCGLHGMDQYEAGDMLHQWKLQQVPHQDKYLVPICFQWNQKKPFLVEWLGQKTFDLIFGVDYRDPLVIAGAINDHCYVTETNPPFHRPHVEMNMYSNEGITVALKHDALHDAIATVKLYQALVKRWHL